MPYLGDFFIVASFGFAVFSLIAYLLAWRGREDLVGLARRFFQISTGSAALAMITLLYLILTHDFTVKYVFSYSSTDMPVYYLWSSLWGGQEGTFLLWVFFVGVMGLVMMRTAGPFERGNMVFVNLFILSILLILLKKSPFELMPVWREEGSGLNPLLQNYWMTIHPPIMFLGFAGAVFPFAFAMTALVERNYQTWSEAARRWTLFAWSGLGVALVLGGYWAYETLGWGGFWAWDPVENSSLIPWLFLTAQVHALFIKRQRRGLLRFSLIAVCLSLWSVLYGTFLTRSGVLADFSVHSFVDLGINQFLIGGLLFFILLGLSLVLWRWRDIDPEKSFATVNSRAYLVTLGVLLLSLGGALVLAGTSSPLITRLAENPSNVGLTYYFNTMTPIAVAILILVSLFPAFRWNKGLDRPRLVIVGASPAAVVIAILLLTGYTNNLLYLLLFGFAAWAIVSNGWVYLLSLRNPISQPGYLSHVGLALALIGAATSAGFATSAIVTLKQNEWVQVDDYRLRFTHMQDTPKGFDCHVEVDDGRGVFVATLPHEFPRNSEGAMKKPFVQNYLNRDLYLSPVSIERPAVPDPGAMTLTKGESGQIGEYAVTFHEFDVSGAHGGESMSDMTAAARLTIVRDGNSEEIAPSLSVSNREITPIVASFDGGRGSVHITGVDPDNGGVMLQFHGDFVPTGDSMVAATLTIDISEKPWIVLFWLGTFLAFAGGGMSMVQRRRRKNRGTEIVETADTERAVVVTRDVA